MSCLRQRCPGCDRQLELPLDSVGKTARCPACEITFEVLAPPDPLPADLLARAAAPPPKRSLGNFDETLPYPANPLTVDAGEEPAASPSTTGRSALNPYHATGADAGLIRIGEFEVREVSMGEVFQRTWEIFQSRWGVILVSGLLMLVACVLAGFVAISALATMGGVINVLNNGLIAFLLMMLSFFGGAYLAMVFVAGLWMCWSRMMISIAQGEDDPISQFIAPGSLMLRTVFSTTVLALVFLGLLVAFLVVCGVMSSVGLEEVATALIFILGTTLYGFGQLIFQFFFWPWILILAHGRSSALGAIRGGFMLAMHNKVNSICLVLFGTVMFLLGTALLGFGLLITLPFVRLTATVMYLMTTNQPLMQTRMSATSGTRAVAGP